MATPALPPSIKPATATSPPSSNPPTTGSTSTSTSILWNKVVLSILITETAERVAYFGFRAILVLYFHNGLQLSESTSISLYAAVAGLAYFSPLFGAILADSSWGRYQTIRKFSTIYCFGMCLLTIAAFQVTTVMEDSNDNVINHKHKLLWERSITFCGLFLICIGTGGIKPCVSAFGADQVVLSDQTNITSASAIPKNNTIISNYSKDSDDDDDEFQVETDIDDQQKERLTGKPDDVVGKDSSTKIPRTSAKQDAVRQFFNSFYFCINVGALSSFAIIPLIRAHFGFGPAFLLPTLCMMFALLVFLSQQRNYKHRIRDSAHPTLSRILLACLEITRKRISRFYFHRRERHDHNDHSHEHFHVPIPSDDDTSNDIGHRSKMNDGLDNDNEIQHNHLVYQDAGKVLHLMPLMLFFPIFWMLYDQQGSVWTLQATRLYLHGLQPEQLQFLNPLEIMIFIPLFDQIIYPCMERRGINIQPLRRMEYGMVLTAISFFASALLEYNIQAQPPNTVSLAWQIPQITIITVAEILLNVTGLEFAYSQAPTNLQALILATFLFMTAIGDGFGALLFATIFGQLGTAATMTLCGLFMLINLGFFHRVACRWKPFSKLDYNQFEDIDEGMELTTLDDKNIS